jgi:hypothetical protein
MPPKKQLTAAQPILTNADRYIAQLSPMEQKTLHIARQHLETSFSLEKSIGYQDWLKQQQEVKR